MPHSRRMRRADSRGLQEEVERMKEPPQPPPDPAKELLREYPELGVLALVGGVRSGGLGCRGPKIYIGVECGWLCRVGGSLCLLGITPCGGCLLRRWW